MKTTYTQTLQIDFVEYCKGYEISEKLQHLNISRLSQYPELVWGIWEDTLASSFPIAYEWINEDIWRTMVADFLKNHPCQSNQLWQMPREFYEYAVSQNWAEKYQLYALHDLLYFEWLEMELYLSPDLTYPNFIDDLSDWKTGLLAINPEMRLIALSYPVHILPPQQAIIEKSHYFLLMFRETESGRIQFVNLSPLHCLLIEKIQDKIPVYQIIAEYQQLFAINDLSEIEKHIYSFLLEMKERGFVLGIKVQ